MVNWINLPAPGNPVQVTYPFRSGDRVLTD